MKKPSSALPWLALILLFALLMGVGMLAAKASRYKNSQADIAAYTPWPSKTVDTFSRILIQDGGRIKPVHTYARYALMQLRGTSTAGITDNAGTKHQLSAVAWLLDVLFRPELARKMPVFTIDDTGVLTGIGLEPGDNKRDRYSYDFIVKGRALLAEKSAEYGRQKDEADRTKRADLELTSTQEQILLLSRKVSQFEFLTNQFSFARGAIDDPSNMLPKEMKDLAKKIKAEELIDKLPAMTREQLFSGIQAQRTANADENVISDSLGVLFFQANSGRGFAVFPPAEPANEVWRSVGDVLLDALATKEQREDLFKSTAQIRGLVGAVDNADEFLAKLTGFEEWQKELTSKRGLKEGNHSSLEVSLMQTAPFYWSLVLFVISFIAVALSWLSPSSGFGRFTSLTGWILAILALGLNTYGIVLRCIIRSRPPITNLYDTIIVITAVAVLFALLAEKITKQRIALAAGVLAGVAGMFLSLAFEAKDASDTMAPLQAVLNTNMWLATHVTTINIGYAGGMIAAFLAIFYLQIRFLVAVGLAEEDPHINRVLVRMVYGAVCFCLFFSFIGTILGGIWANYSWGRFWGWDPKENGALIICLWTMAILHSRLGGYLRDIGLSVASVFLAVIVTFSWWGVNELGVGLHSYGKTSGVMQALYITWFVLGLYMAAAIPIWLKEKAAKKAKTQPPAPSIPSTPELA